MFNAILNVLAIIVLVFAIGFIILLLVDLVLGCIDGKRGVLFFRNRKNTNRDNEILMKYNSDINLNDSYYIQNNDKNLTLEFDKEYEKENKEVQNNNIDFSKAEDEQKLVEENKNVEPYKEENEDFTFINKVSPELEKEIDLEETVPSLPKVELNEIDEDEDFDFDFMDDEEDEEDDDDKSIEEILQAIKQRNMMARNRFLKEQEIEADFEEDETIKSEEEVIEDLKQEKEEVEEAVKEVETIEVEDNSKNEEIEKLNAIIKELNEKIEQEQKKNQEIKENAKKELESLKQELDKKVEPASENVTEQTLTDLEEELVKLQERQKQNDKDLKQNKKEYIPLARNEKTLANDEEKLRRRTAIVAKKKMVIYGVNNYVQDEEKEKKLQEDLDLLEALRNSVNHCKEVMELNKDRYPVLKRTNEILTRNAENLENDILALEEKIKNVKEILNKSTDNGNE